MARKKKPPQILNKKPGKISDLYKSEHKPKKKGKAGTDSAFMLKVRKRSNQAATEWSDNWKHGEHDLRFLNGDQWDEQIKTERRNDGRPCLVNNVLPTFVDQIIGEQLQDRPAIKISSTSVTRVTEEPEAEELKISNTAGTKDYTLAEVMTGLIMNIEYQCDAESHYDESFKGAVSSFAGFLRARTDYIGKEGFEQDIIIEAIQNQFSVSLGPMGSQPDYSDVPWLFIHSKMPRDEFKEKYPDATPCSLDTGAEKNDSWSDEDTVRVSEYFERESKEKELVKLSDGREMYMEDIEPIVDELLEQGITIARMRKVIAHNYIWRKVTGLEVLEGPIDLKCSRSPVVPVFGKKLVIKDKVYYRSAIRYSKDPQLMANFFDSAAAESVALAPKAPFVATEDQIEGYENDWDNANKKNISVLKYTKESPNDPGPQRQQPAATPAAELTLGMGNIDKIKSTMGMFDASLGAAGNETSGRAIVARQRQGNRGNFEFGDNLVKSKVAIGRLLLEMIPNVYDTERVVRLKFADGTEDFVKLNEQIFDDETNQYVTISDLGIGKYDVIVTTGPSFATQRQEAAETMIQFAQAVPSAAAAMADLIAQNMDWPGADVIADRLKKIMPPNLLSTEERKAIEEDSPEPPPPTPEQELQMKELETKDLESNAKIAQAEVDLAQTEVDKVKLQLESEQAQREMAVINQGADGGNIAMQQVREMVAEALAEVLAANAPNQA